MVDDEIWARVMKDSGARMSNRSSYDWHAKSLRAACKLKEWLGTSDPSRFAPVPKHQGGGLPSARNPSCAATQLL